MSDSAAETKTGAEAAAAGDAAGGSAASTAAAGGSGTSSSADAKTAATPGSSAAAATTSSSGDAAAAPATSAAPAAAAAVPAGASAQPTKKREREDDDNDNESKRLAATASSQEDVVVDYYYIPDEMTGKVIGKSGATVHTIQSLSGCHIDIPQHCEPSEPGKPLRRKVEIKGTPAQIAYAKSIINQKCTTSDGSIPLPSEGAIPDPTDPVRSELMHVDNDLVGRLIGKAGATIRQLQELSGAHITVAREPRPGSNVRELTIMGKQQQIAECRRYIQMKIEGQPLPVMPDSMAPTELIVHIPDSMVGRVIGRGGATIRELQDMSRAHIDIEKHCLPGTDQREVVIKGAPAAAEHCKQLLMAKIGGSDMYGASSHSMPPPTYQPYSAPPAYAAAPAQYAAPGAYGNQYYPQQYQGYEYPQHQMDMGMQAPPVPAAAMPPVHQDPYGYAQAQQPPQYGAPVPAAPVHAYGAPPGGQTSSSMPIPDELAGRIIGKGGASVKAIQAESGAHIDVPPSGGSKTRILTITGTPAQIQHCMSLVEARLRSSGPRF